MNIHSGRTPYTCKVCEKKFASSSSLHGHMLIHTGEKRYKCDICDKAFTASSTRGKHMKMVHNPEERANRKPSERRFKCEICEQAFSRKMNLNVHMKSHSTSRGILGQDDETEECPICFKIIAKNSKYHMKTHEKGVKVYECKVCDAKFNQSESLRAHMSHHTGIKDFVCSVCSKAFSVSSRLTKHMRIHTGEKRYVWSIGKERTELKNCCIMLPSADLYVKFVNEHSPIVQHCIDIERYIRPKRISYVRSARKPSHNHQVFSFTWGYTQVFIERSLPKVKQRLIKFRVRFFFFAGEKPHVCKVCTKAFHDSSSLSKHMNLHLPEKPFQCKWQKCCGIFFDSKILYFSFNVAGQICLKKFNQKYCLKKHLETHENDHLLKGEKNYRVIELA